MIMLFSKYWIGCFFNSFMNDAILKQYFGPIIPIFWASKINVNFVFLLYNSNHLCVNCEKSLSFRTTPVNFTFTIGYLTSSNVTNIYFKETY